MWFLVVGLALFFGSSVLGRPSPLDVALPSPFAKNADLAQPCVTRNGSLSDALLSTLNCSTTPLGASSFRDWDEWQNIRVLSGNKGVYYFPAHPVHEGDRYEIVIKSTRKMSTIDLIFQNEQLQEENVIQSGRIHHTQFGPWTFGSRIDGFVFIRLHFRPSILPFFGKTRTIRKGRLPPASNLPASALSPPVADA